MSYEGSAEENKARLFCRQLGIDYDKLTKEEFVTLINILKKATLLNNQPVKKHNHGHKKKRK